MPGAPRLRRGAECAESRDVRELQDENRRLKKLLVASMLEVASLKEALES